MLLKEFTLMRSVTHPLFPAQAGAVTLQEVIDAREGDRLPLDVALYVSGEVGKQVTQLQAQGREGALDPKRVWCTSKGAVVVHEAAGGTTDPHALSDLVYRLLSGSGDITAWPPSYFNPSVAESIDAAVMKAVAEDRPEARTALLDVVRSAATEVDAEAAVDGMARLVYAVADEPKVSYAPRRTSTMSDALAAVVPPPAGWFTPRRTAIAAGLALMVLLGMTVLAVSGRPPAPPPAAAVPASKPATLTPAEIRLRTVEAIQATRKPAKAAPSAKKALAKRK